MIRWWRKWKLLSTLWQKSLEAGVGDGGSNKGTPDAAYIYYHCVVINSSNTILLIPRKCIHLHIIYICKTISLGNFPASEPCFSVRKHHLRRATTFCLEMAMHFCTPLEWVSIIQIRHPRKSSCFVIILSFVEWPYLGHTPPILGHTYISYCQLYPMIFLTGWLFNAVWKKHSRWKIPPLKMHMPACAPFPPLRHRNPHEIPIFDGKPTILGRPDMLRLPWAQNFRRAAVSNSCKALGPSVEFGLQR